MFSHPEDPQSIIGARIIEVEMIITCIELARARTKIGKTCKVLVHIIAP